MKNTMYDWSKELLPDETLFWSGRPNPSVLFTRFDILFVPLSVIWSIFIILWTINVARSGGISSFFALFGVPGIFAGYYCMVGRFLYKRNRKACMHHAITNQRVMSVICDAKGKRVRLISSYLKQIHSSSIDVNGKGIGTIQFGDLPFFPSHYSIYVNTGLDFLAIGINDIVVFVDIDDAGKVYELYKAARSE